MANIIKIESPFGNVDVLVTDKHIHLKDDVILSLMVGKPSFTYFASLMPIYSIISANLSGYNLTENKGITEANKNLLKLTSSLPVILNGGTIVTGIDLIGYIRYTHLMIQEGKLTFLGYRNLMETENRLVIEPLVSIDLNSIEDIKFEDATTVENKVTATRLIALGIFAFAAKKKIVDEKYFVTLKWKSSRFDEEIILNFSGKNSNSLANNLIHKVKTACIEIEKHKQAE
jgi:hypothetical protein